MVLYKYTGQWLGDLGLPKGSLIKYICTFLIYFIPTFGATYFIAAPTKNIFKALGLNGNALKGLAVAVVCTLPLFVGFLFTSPLNKEMNWEYGLKTVVFAALFEEIIFRGFLFGMLFRYLKIGFVLAALIPSLLFGSIHLYQGADLISALIVFAVTFIGALYFSWMYVEWHFNLWVPVFLHLLMNLSWYLFATEGNTSAAGGLASNIFRLISIALAITLTLWYRKKHSQKLIAYKWFS